jgi:DNA-binding IclR family transcriptional regulator
MAEISKTADRALSLLVAVAENGPISTAELSRRLGINRTVAQRLLTTLHQRGFVQRTQAGYVPGAALLQTAGQFFLAAREVALPVMQRLSDTIGETVVLHVLDVDAAVVVAQVPRREHVVRVERELGTRDPLTAGASGRALLAFQPEATVARVLAGVDDRAALQRDLERIARRGYATSPAGEHNGVVAIAAPVRGTNHAALASVGILVPRTRAGPIEHHRDALLAAAEEIDAALDSRSKGGRAEPDPD